MSFMVNHYDSRSIIIIAYNLQEAIKCERAKFKKGLQFLLTSLVFRYYHLSPVIWIIIMILHPYYYGNILNINNDQKFLFGFNLAMLKSNLERSLDLFYVWA